MQIATIKKKEKRTPVLASKFRKHSDRQFLSGNILDSSNPKRSRGKHRETRKKKLSLLKATIIRERILKLKAKEKAGSVVFTQQEVKADEIDFKTEVPLYLESLKSRKTMENTKKENKACAREFVPKEVRFSSKFRE